MTVWGTALGRARPGASHHPSCLLDSGLAVRRERAHRHHALDVPTVVAAWDDYAAEELTGPA